MKWFITLLLIASVAVLNSECSSFNYTKVSKSPTYGVVGKDLKLQWQYTCTDPTCPSDLYAIVFGVPGRYFIFKDIRPSGDGKVHMFPLSGRNKTIDDKYRGRVSLENGNTMVIANFTVADAVTYVSKLLTNDGSNIITRYVTVKAAVAPKFTQTPPSTQIHLTEGKSLSLKCEAAGIPSPLLTWKKDGVLLSKSSTYSISMVTAQDIGTYTCEASNIAGKITWQGQIVFPATGGTLSTPMTMPTPTSHGGGTTGDNKGDNSTPLGVLLGAIIGAVVFVALIIAVFLILKRKRDRAPKDIESRNRLTHNEVVHYSKEEREVLVSSGTSKEHAHDTADISTLEAHPYETADNRTPEVHPYETADKSSPKHTYETAYNRKLEAHSYESAGINSEDHPYATAGNNASKIHHYKSADRSKESLYASADSLHSVNSIADPHTYAQVDKTKTKKKPKPGELYYADLDHLDDPSPSRDDPQSPTKYADIQNPVPKEAEYYNVPNLRTQSQDNLYATIQNPDV